MKPSRTVGITKNEETLYHVYYGPSTGQKNVKTFHDEDAADKFFMAKQNAKLHVEVYKEVVESVRTITRLA